MDPKQRRKLLALADRLILMSRGLTSEQSADAIALAEEFAPLAEFAIEKCQNELDIVARYGPCGMRYHAKDCDCGGVGGDR